MSRARTSRLLLAHEGRWLASLGLWVARRQDGTKEPGVRAFGYARAQAPLVLGFAFVCLAETVGVSFLLAAYPVAHAIVLVLDVYTVLMALGMHAAAVTRPHLVGREALRLRNGARLDTEIPLARVATVRRDLRFPKEKPPAGVLEAAVAGQTSVTLELSAPVTVVRRFLGPPEEVRTVRFHADDARAAVAALREAVAAVGVDKAAGEAAEGARAADAAEPERGPGPRPRPGPEPEPAGP
ncbi:hypothetical protein C3486_27485 [Streptomyces sp. Ru73]|uniref:hypothetical protein n=1 Tax=Streptomyces sp. Ru73 TaxID=2080748 RepID=UPI000CDD68D8|nr:hypothetical protein [Streptomyces sp. Ru73]POX37608.1 hypothetical protein C3486_27485 [Streptomyces sp. Ru73]